MNKRELKELIKETISEILKEDLIDKTLDDIKSQIGLELKPDTDFPGVKKRGGISSFNVYFPDTDLHSSNDYSKLLRFATKYKSIKVEPNGRNRLTIFILK